MIFNSPGDIIDKSHNKNNILIKIEKCVPVREIRLNKIHCGFCHVVNSISETFFMIQMSEQ